ncbi:response regulator [Arenimonas alkanexedens]
MNPRLLLVEDDAVSAAFLSQALAPLPLRLALASDLAQARALADERDVLWVFDARLPDGRGDALLAELRALGFTVPALALTAEDDPAVLAALGAAGFAAVLAKPISAIALRQLVAATIAASLPRWDDEAALSALGGEPATVLALRKLFLKELPGQADAIATAWSGRDDGNLREHLHRLKASCAFVGAAALLDAVRALHAAPADAGTHARFQAEAAAMVVADQS